MARAKIHVLATGGTIAGLASGPVDAAYEAGKLSIAELLSTAPEAGELAQLTGEEVASIGSQDVDDAIWLSLARRISELLEGDVDGIVVMSGTDTMEETAFFLHLVINSHRPIVLTGAMRPANALSADGPLNIYNAVAVAADPSARSKGVLVVANDKIHGARSVVKANTTVVDTLESPGRGPIGTVHFGATRYFRTPQRPHTRATPFEISGISELPRVDIVYAHAGMDEGMIESAVERGAQGIVLAGVGNGNLSTVALGALTEAARSGIACVRSTRLHSGVVARDVEVDDAACGLIAAYELSPQKARILLQLSLLAGMGPRRIQELFLHY